MTATKSDLVNAVAEANGFPQNKSAEIVEILVDLIKSKLAADEDVLISGFGRFCVKKKRASERESESKGGTLQPVRI